MNKNSIQKNTNEILTIAVPAGFVVAIVVSLKSDSFKLAGIAGAITTCLIMILTMIYKKCAINKLESSSAKEKETRSVKEAIQVCPRCGSKLVLKNGKRGKFYGCSAFPQCRFSKEI